MVLKVTVVLLIMFAMSLKVRVISSSVKTVTSRSAATKLIENKHFLDWLTLKLKPYFDTETFKMSSTKWINR